MPPAYDTVFILKNYNGELRTKIFDGVPSNGSFDTVNKYDQHTNKCQFSHQSPENLHLQLI